MIRDEKSTIHFYTTKNNDKEVLTIVIDGDLSYYYSKGSLTIGIPFIKFLKETFEHTAGFICGVDLQDIVNIVSRANKSINVKFHPNYNGKIFTVAMKGYPPLIAFKIQMRQPTSNSIQFSIDKDELMKLFDSYHDLDFDFSIENGVIKRESRECTLILAGSNT